MQKNEVQGQGDWQDESTIMALMSFDHSLCLSVLSHCFHLDFTFNRFWHRRVLLKNSMNKKYEKFSIFVFNNVNMKIRLNNSLHFISLFKIECSSVEIQTKMALLILDEDQFFLNLTFIFLAYICKKNTLKGEYSLAAEM